MKRFAATAALVAAAFASMLLASARQPAAMVEWPYVGSEQAQTKYSTAGEITAANVGELEIVWQWRPNEKPPYAHLVAIDLNAGDIAWKAPFGAGSRELREHPLLRGVELPERLGTRGNAGPMATEGGLVFVGGGNALPVCVRQGDGGRGLARCDAVQNLREPDDLPCPVGAAVRRHRDGPRSGRGARRVCATQIANDVLTEMPSGVCRIGTSGAARPFIAKCRRGIGLHDRSVRHCYRRTRV